MEKGFTLIEILVGVGILSMVTMFIGFFALDVSDFGIFLGDTLTAQQELQQTLIILSTELRSMGPSDNGSYLIESAASLSFTFYSNTDDDDNFERVRYFLSGTTFRKGLINPTGNPAVYNPANEIVVDVAHDIIASSGNPIFLYFPSDYTGVEAPLTYPLQTSDIRLVKVNLTSDRTPLDQLSRVYFSATTKIRNLSND